MKDFVFCCHCEKYQLIEIVGEQCKYCKSSNLMWGCEKFGLKEPQEVSNDFNVAEFISKHDLET